MFEKNCTDLRGCDILLKTGYRGVNFDTKRFSQNN